MGVGRKGKYIWADLPGFHNSYQSRWLDSPDREPTTAKRHLLFSRIIHLKTPAFSEVVYKRYPSAKEMLVTEGSWMLGRMLLEVTERERERERATVTERERARA